jgi:hypothetical protein
VCVYVYPPIIARQWCSEHIPTAVNTHATIEELLDMFSVQSLLNQRKVCMPLCVSPLLLLGNGYVNMFLWQWIHATVEE